MFRYKSMHQIAVALAQFMKILEKRGYYKRINRRHSDGRDVTV